jgi:hypothetical protein
MYDSSFKKGKMRIRAALLILSLGLTQACSGMGTFSGLAFRGGTSVPQARDVVSAQPQALFIEAAPPENLSGTSGPQIMRARYVTLNQDLLRAISASTADQAPSIDRFTLNLFDDATYQAVYESLETPSQGNFIWLGHLEGQPDSQVSLAIEAGIMSGSVSLPGASYQVRYLGEGLHAIYQIDQSAYPPD